MDVSALTTSLALWGTQFGLTVLGALVLWLVGRRLIGFAVDLTQRAPRVEILAFTAMGPVLAVRPSCHTDHYWQIYFDTNRAIREAFGEAGFPTPQQHCAIRSESPAGSPNGGAR